MNQVTQFRNYYQQPTVTAVAVAAEPRLNLGGAIGLSFLAHLLLILLFPLVLFLLQFLGIHIPLFEPLAFKERDLEFTLVEAPPEPPRNKNTRLRSTQMSRSGGQRQPNKPIAQTIKPKGPVGPKRQPSPPPQPKAVAPPKQARQPARQAPQQQAPQPKATPQKAPQPTPPAPPAPTVSKAPQAAPIPSPPKPPSIRMPAPPAPKSIAAGPIAPSAGYGRSSGASSGSSGDVGPSQIPGSSRSGSGIPGAAGGGAGGTGNYDQDGSPGGGGGRPGVDALPAPDYGAYMAELQRRIKRNWHPPAAQEDKRVVLQFNIGKDGRLLNVTVQKSSGYSEADNAALSAVRLSAPFRPLPPGHKDNDLSIQFTFDYNVYKSSGRLTFR
jgi:TonB family protein